MHDMVLADNMTIIPPGDPEAVEIGRLYRQGLRSASDAVLCWADAGRKLIAKKKLLKDEFGHGSWLQWVEQNIDVLGFEILKAQRLMKIATLLPNTSPAMYLDDKTALPLLRKLWGHATRGTTGTGENEWFTPAEIIADARRVLGVIDLDPASTEQAQATVQALQFLTIVDDGLSQEWHGNVWLNPPYAQPHIGHFADKMIAEFNAGRVKSAIMLTHNYTDTAWFQKLAKRSNAVCFPKGRIRFIDPSGELASPTQGQAFFYFGPDAKTFVSVFSARGIVGVLQ